MRLLTSNATQEQPGPIQIGEVGGVISVSQHGIYKSIYLFMIEVKPQFWEFVLIISRRNFRYIHYKAKFWMTSPKLTNMQGEMQEIFQKYQSSWENRLHGQHQLPRVLPKDDIPITIRTDHLWICLWECRWR